MWTTIFRSAVLVISAACTIISPNQFAALARIPSASIVKSVETDKDSPKIIDVQIRSLGGDAKKVTFTLAIIGKNLCKPGEKPEVQFSMSKLVQKSNNTECVEGTEVRADGETTAPAHITGVSMVIGGKRVSSSGYSVSIRPNPPAPKLEEFQIKFDHQKNKQFPNLHSILVTKESGDDDVGFETNPLLMQVELIPTGATDITIVQSNKQQMDLHFVAAADYEPQMVLVTVYDGTDLAKRNARAVAKPFLEKKPAEDPDQPKIDSVEVVFLERSQGRGRIRINGKGFGDYPSPPYPVDDYLNSHLQRSSIKGTVEKKGTVERECTDASDRKRAYGQLVTGKSAPTGSEVRKDKCLTESDVATLIQNTMPEDKWPAWQEPIRSNVNVGLTSRNADLRIEKTTIININDSMVDVYFEFSRFPGYSEPLRLSNVAVTVLKHHHKTMQIEKKGDLTATLTGPSVQTYTAAADIGPKAATDLTYDYTMMDEKSASVLLGKGIAQNFYVLKVSVVNEGAKKVSIPLAAIQAEVEWARGHQIESEPEINGSNEKSRIDYLEGNPIITPSPLAAVSAYFDAYNKNHGKRAKLSNVLDALTLMGTALVPYVGPSFKDAQVFWSGGFVPGVHKAIGDISGQQLQNLTALSWQNSETLPPQGGSIIKLIYIQKNPQFANQAVTIDGVKRETRKVITNLLNLEITGYEIEESQPKQATQQTTTQNSETPPTTGGSGAGANASSSSTTTPATSSNGNSVGSAPGTGKNPATLQKKKGKDKEPKSPQ